MIIGGLCRTVGLLGAGRQVDKREKLAAIASVPSRRSGAGGRTDGWNEGRGKLFSLFSPPAPSLDPSFSHFFAASIMVLLLLLRRPPTPRGFLFRGTKICAPGRKTYIVRRNLASLGPVFLAATDRIGPCQKVSPAGGEIGSFAVWTDKTKTTRPADGRGISGRVQFRATAAADKCRLLKGDS